MTVGIMTFHWAANYGAVLQAFALQEFLRELGFDAVIINYLPRRLILRDTARLIARGRIKTLRVRRQKERKIKPFRTGYLRLTKRYGSFASLKSCTGFDAVIAGSDQIWNESFTMCGERGPTLSYFLDFTDALRISYAASFGAESIPPLMADKVAGPLSAFSALSVRERGGVEILKKMGFQAELVCDPALLFGAEFYQKRLSLNNECSFCVFGYILHRGWKVSSLAEDIVKNICGKRCFFGGGDFTVEQWLSAIKNSGFVVTDSYHCVVFAILFRRPFIALVNEENSMKDRFVTLLCILGLEDRIVYNANEGGIRDLLAGRIEWDEVFKRLDRLRQKSSAFLRKSLGRPS